MSSNTVAVPAAHASRRVAEIDGKPPKRHMAEAARSTAISVGRGSIALTATASETVIGSKLRFKIGSVVVHRHHSKSLQLDGALDQTLDEHESPLRYLASFTTFKYLMWLMLFNPQPHSPCTRSRDEPFLFPNSIECGSSGTRRPALRRDVGLNPPPDTGDRPHARPICRLLPTVRPNAAGLDADAKYSLLALRPELLSPT